ncbi:MAG TPA: twin-arginine translocase TatA/TatE family subunit [Bryobacteraceae bacterium]|nr:twin-arginine translocase TatA/TatE family subunit [Bryobacteraceae bacterium]
MGPLGWQETLAIFILALILFGPKKLPELGKTLGKAITEFRRASSELRSSFDREMRNLEQETAPIKDAASEYSYQSYSYSSGPQYDHSAGAEGSEFSEFTASHPQLESASATEGAESVTSSLPPEGTVAVGHIADEHTLANGKSGEPTAAPEPHAASGAAAPTVTTEHKA